MPAYSNYNIIKQKIESNEIEISIWKFHKVETDDLERFPAEILAIRINFTNITSQTHGITDEFLVTQDHLIGFPLSWVKSPGLK